MTGTSGTSRSQELRLCGEIDGKVDASLTLSIKGVGYICGSGASYPQDAPRRLPPCGRHRHRHRQALP